MSVLSKLYLMIVIFSSVAFWQQRSNAKIASAPMPAGDMARAKMAQNYFDGEASLTEISEPTATSVTVKRHIALRHSLTVETPAKKTQAEFDIIALICLSA